MPDLSLQAHVGIFLLGALVILVSGTKLSAVADQLADRTGWGEALMGATLLGGSTSLPGITASVTAAWTGYPQLAISNAIGGIAAQTAFLAVADFFYRRANLEHAATSVPNMINGLLVVILLGGVLVAADSPPGCILGIHPVTVLLLAGYIFGIRLARRSHEDPQWKPQQTPQTRPDVPEAINLREGSGWRMWGTFVVCGLLVAIAGWFVARSGTHISKQTGLSQSVVGALFVAVATSTPELVTTVAAVRRGALTLAVGGVLGGNAFDVLFAVAADIAYRPGSIYHAISPRERFLAALTIVMTTILVVGMISREKRGLANIGFESALILVCYLTGVGVLVWGA